MRQRHLEPSVGTKEEPETALRGLCNPFVLCGVQVHWENSEAPSKQKGTRATTESTPFCERFPAATPGSRRTLAPGTASRSARGAGSRPGTLGLIFFPCKVNSPRVQCCCLAERGGKHLKCIPLSFLVTERPLAARFQVPLCNRGARGGSLLSKQQS